MLLRKSRVKLMKGFSVLKYWSGRLINEDLSLGESNEINNILMQLQTISRI